MERLEINAKKKKVKHGRKAAYSNKWVESDKKNQTRIPQIGLNREMEGLCRQEILSLSIWIRMTASQDQPGSPSLILPSHTIISSNASPSITV